jgi:hypothetical protein
VASDASEATSGVNSSESRNPAREIEIHAGHVDIEGPFNRLSLSKGVELTVHRYRVTADNLRLERTAQGIGVEGTGSVAFCPCGSSPLTVGFTKATVAPPTDLLLRNATFRACSVPVFWLPIYWIRSPNKFGLLSPVLAYRGYEGPWIGSGIHVPLLSKSVTDREADFLVGAYLFGGVDLGVKLRSPRAVTSVRWDHYQRSLLEIQSNGYHQTAQQASFSWQVDALRGARARTGPVSFEQATRNFDRGRSEWATGTAESLFGVGVQADMTRGNAFGELGRIGPAARFATGGALGDWGSVDSSVLVMGRAGNDFSGAASALHSSSIGVDFRPGPTTLHLGAREHWLVSSGSERNFNAGAMGAELRGGLPLVADWGSESPYLSHWVEPFFIAAAAESLVSSAYERTGAQPVLTLQAGLLNKVGQLSGGAATSLQLRVGGIASKGDTVRAGAARWLASGNWLALGGDLAIAERSSRVSSLRARIGRVDRIALRARAEGMTGSESNRLRWLFDEGWTPWLSRWFSRQGWLLSGDLDFAVGAQFAATGGAAYDVGSNALVAEQAGVAYRHPCGCLASSARAGWRVGRRGWDIVILLDLMP